MTIAPFSFPRNFAKSFFSFASKYTTAPVIAPGVLGDHPAAAIVSGCSAGLTIRALAVPRAHERSIVHPSRCAFTAPYFANMSRVQSFACLSCGEPVSRAPMLSDKYSRFAAASLCSRISLRICASAAANGLFSSAAAPANPPRTTAKASTTPHTDTPIRRNLIHLPQNSIWILLLIPQSGSQRNRRLPLASPHSFLKTRASQATVSHPTCLAPPLARTRRWLALRAKVAAPPCDNQSPDRRPATETALPFAPVHPMMPLIFSRLALGVKKIGNRRPARQNCLPQNVLQNTSQHLRLFLVQLRSPPHRMNLGTPQTFVRIDISDSPQHALIQQQRLDMRLPRTNTRRKLLRAHQQRLGPKCRQLLSQQLRSKIGHSPKAPRIRITQLPPIIQLKPHVCMLRTRLPSPARRKLTGHPQM